MAEHVPVRGIIGPWCVVLAGLVGGLVAPTGVAP